MVRVLHGQSKIFDCINIIDRGVDAPINSRNIQRRFPACQYLYVVIVAVNEKAKSH